MKSLEEAVSYQRILVDTLNVVTASFFYNSAMQKSHGLTSGMLYGSFRLLLSTRTLYPHANMYFLWEGWKQDRKLEYPDYKGNRPNKSELTGYKESLTDFKQALQYFGDSQVWHSKWEADDLAAFYVYASSIPTLLISNDQDWWKFLNKTTDVYYRGSIYNYYDIKRKLGYSPEKIDIYKILRGDKSDNIKPVYPRFSEKHAMKLVEYLDSADDLYDYTKVVKYIPSVWASRVCHDGDSNLEKNYYLVKDKAMYICDDEENIQMQNYKFDKERFESFLQSRNIGNLVN